MKSHRRVALALVAALAAGCSSSAHHATPQSPAPRAGAATVSVSIDAAPEVRKVTSSYFGGGEGYAKDAQVHLHPGSATVLEALDAQGNATALGVAAEIPGFTHRAVQVDYRSTAIVQVLGIPGVGTYNPVGVGLIQAAAYASPHLAVAAQMLQRQAASDPAYLAHPDVAELTEVDALVADIRASLDRAAHASALRHAAYGGGGGVSDGVYRVRPQAAQVAGYNPIPNHDYDQECKPDTIFPIVASSTPGRTPGPSRTGVCFTRSTHSSDATSGGDLRLTAKNYGPSWAVVFTKNDLEVPVAILQPQSYSLFSASDLVGALLSTPVSIAESTVCNVANFLLSDGCKKVFGDSAPDPFSQLKQIFNNLDNVGNTDFTLTPAQQNQQLVVLTSDSRESALSSGSIMPSGDVADAYSLRALPLIPSEWVETLHFLTVFSLYGYPVFHMIYSQLPGSFLGTSPSVDVIKTLIPAFQKANTNGMFTQLLNDISSAHSTKQVLRDINEISLGVAANPVFATQLIGVLVGEERAQGALDALAKNKGLAGEAASALKNVSKLVTAIPDTLAAATTIFFGTRNYIDHRAQWDTVGVFYREDRSRVVCVVTGCQYSDQFLPTPDQVGTVGQDGVFNLRWTRWDATGAFGMGDYSPVGNRYQTAPVTVELKTPVAAVIPAPPTRTPSFPSGAPVVAADGSVMVFSQMLLRDFRPGHPPFTLQLPVPGGSPLPAPSPTSTDAIPGALSSATPPDGSGESTDVINVICGQRNHPNDTVWSVVSTWSAADLGYFRNLETRGRLYYTPDHLYNHYLGFDLRATHQGPTLGYYRYDIGTGWSAYTTEPVHHRRGRTDEYAFHLQVTAPHTPGPGQHLGDLADFKPACSTKDG